MQGEYVELILVLQEEKVVDEKATNGDIPKIENGDVKETNGDLKKEEVKEEGPARRDWGSVLYN